MHRFEKGKSLYQNRVFDDFFRKFRNVHSKSIVYDFKFHTKQLFELIIASGRILSNFKIFVDPLVGRFGAKHSPPASSQEALRAKSGVC